MNTGNPIFITYYTGNSYYSECAKSIKSTCDLLGINIIIDKLEDTGFYWKNTLIKPSYILEKIKSLKSDVIWIDVDTKIFKYHDCFKKWDSDITVASHTGDLQGIKASPIGIKYNDRALKLLESWESVCKHKISCNDVDLDHDILKYEILPDMSDKISMSIMTNDNNYIDFTNGSIIDNGISRVANKGREMKIVIDKNSMRDGRFKSMDIKNFSI